MKINWKEKLTSRKFWAALMAVILCLLSIFGVEELTAEQVEALGWAVASLIAYILGEGFVDAKNSGNKEG
jgi:uncharacterized membrane protein